ncbi:MULTISPECIES: hypothetical protein [unclassified Chelatococcus]|jgi:hypothetical protein|uniref:hypothetical protein n=1 Tax=unclassified Chelatococcus TaxID=2638111 RepID=UPI0020BE7A3C|nr:MULTISPECIES: hypothetical protein [unclassified Chelatococcus]MCO5077041.1 hypothetical protein [Chelatococcus sp.]CAH1671174.1 conserved exported hypothetical protein [Hyphomicrobiales bacterium]CAH1676609.1 conserved exported hypothetical protein [Hyphomicrobiales bacterium]
MHFSLKGAFLAVAIAAGGIGFGGSAQAAGPIAGGAASALPASAADLVQQVQYWGPPGYYGRRYYGPPRRYYRPRPYYGYGYGPPRYRPRVVCGWRWQPSPWGPRRVRVCWQR